MKSKYYVIGDPVVHSLSPLIHNTLYKIYGINAEYAARRLTPETLPRFLQEPEEGLRGCNVTMPLKEAVVPYLAEARAQGGVNTIRLDADGWRGFSTDARGFFKGLAIAGTSFEGKNVVVLGGGAVSRTLTGSPQAKSARSIAVLSRKITSAESTADEISLSFGLLSHINGYLPQCDILINATPLGMEGYHADFSDFSFLDALPAASLVCDLIYNPAKTRLLAAAEQTGHPIQNGLPMLIWQAFYAFKLFFGILPGEAEYETIAGILQSQR